MIDAGDEEEELDVDTEQLGAEDATSELRDSQMVRIDVSKSRDALFLLLNYAKIK